MANGQTLQLTIGKAEAEMDWLQWSSSVIGSIAWPIAAVIIAAIFRKQIASLLKRIKEASWGGAKINFGEKLDEIEEDTRVLVGNEPEAVVPTNPPEEERFQKLLAISPNAAILDAWSQVEGTLVQRANAFGIKYLDPREPIDRRLADSNLLNASAIRIVREMRKIRNAAAHNQEMTTTDAIRFQSLAKTLEQVISRTIHP